MRRNSHVRVLPAFFFRSDHSRNRDRKRDHSWCGESAISCRYIVKIDSSTLYVSRTSRAHLRRRAARSSSVRVSLRGRAGNVADSQRHSTFRLSVVPTTVVPLPTCPPTRYARAVIFLFISHFGRGPRRAVSSAFAFAVRSVVRCTHVAHAHPIRLRPEVPVCALRKRRADARKSRGKRTRKSIRVVYIRATRFGTKAQLTRAHKSPNPSRAVEYTKSPTVTSIIRRASFQRAESESFAVR